MTHASICSGLDGPALAASWLGWKNLFHADINKFTNQILKYHYPDATHYTDIRQTDFTRWQGKVDVLSAGFPCQPFSVAGLRTGEDHDSYLWPETLRVVGEVRPRWFVGENVNGIASMVFPGEEVEVAKQADLFGAETPIYESVGRYIIDRICCDLEEIGYEVIPIAIPACAVEAPHERMRIFFLCHDTTYTDSNGGSTQTEQERGAHGEDNEQSESILGGHDIENSLGIRCDGIKSEEKPHERGQQVTGTGDNKRICRASGVAADRSDAGFEDMPKPQIGVYAARPAADAECRRGNEVHENIQSQKSNGHGIDGACRKRDVTESESIGLQGREPESNAEDGKWQSRRFYREHSIPKWQHFPTQPPVCRRDDGFPGRISGITVSQWIVKSIEALGNAIVPQQIYEIFRMIDIIEKRA